MVKKQTIAADGFTSSTYPEGYSPDKICDGNLGTGWSMTMNDAPGYITFELKTAATVEKLILYARIGAANDVVSRSNFTITGITSSGERIELFTTSEDAYTEYGMLVIDVAETAY